MASPAATRELTVTRVLDAPIEKVWQSWTDPRAVARWWGPKGVTNPTCQWEAQPGGGIYIVMLAGRELGPMAGEEWPMRGTFQEVIPHKGLVFTNIAVDAQDNHLIEGLTTITFEDMGAKTKMTVHVTATGVTPAAQKMLEGMDQGWNEQLDKLGAFVR